MASSWIVKLKSSFLAKERNSERLCTFPAHFLCTGTVLRVREMLVTNYFLFFLAKRYNSYFFFFIKFCIA